MITSVEFIITAEQLRGAIKTLCGIDPDAPIDIEATVSGADGQVVGEIETVTVNVQTDMAGARKIERRRKARGLTTEETP